MCGPGSPTGDHAALLSFGRLAFSPRLDQNQGTACLPVSEGAVSPGGAPGAASPSYGNHLGPSTASSGLKVFLPLAFLGEFLRIKTVELRQPTVNTHLSLKDLPWPRAPARHAKNYQRN